MRMFDGSTGSPSLATAIFFFAFVFCFTRAIVTLPLIWPLGTKHSADAIWKVTGHGLAAICLYAIMSGGAL